MAALVDVVALVLGAVAFVAQMPLASKESRIAMFFQGFGDGVFFQLQRKLIWARTCRIIRCAFYQKSVADVDIEVIQVVDD